MIPDVNLASSIWIKFMQKVSLLNIPIIPFLPGGYCTTRVPTTSCRFKWFQSLPLIIYLTTI